MKVKKLTKFSVIGITFLLAGVLLIPAKVDAKNPVRPIKMLLEGYKVNEDGFPPAIGTEEYHYDVGVASHLGKCVNEWISTVVRIENDSVNNLVIIHSTGIGTLTAANGDTIEWESVFTVSSAGIIEGSVTSTGGSGRFLNVNMEISASGQLTKSDPEKTYYTFTAEGTISY